MKNPNIGQILRKHRKLAHLSVTQVSEALKTQNNHAAPKTIYGWENGHTQPDADTLMFLCTLYHIDNPLETFGYQESSDYSNISLSPKERMLILQYRKQTNLQYAIDRLLGLENAPTTQSVSRARFIAEEGSSYQSNINYLDESNE